MKVILVVISAIFTATVGAKSLNTPPVLTFIQGKYTVVGREAGSGKPYSGVMLIENVDNKTVRMIETVKQQPKRVWIGQFRMASPGEGWVLAVEGKRGSMACPFNVPLEELREG
jgi:hypothetical protein